jgi:8-oxo-dGTP pyrophosphatase MutT (NUDIX family)
MYAVNDYRDLPDRYIIKRSPINRVLNSHGCIVFYGKGDDRRWLIVQRRISIEFALLVSGDYRKSDIPKYISGVTSDEKILLLKAVDDKMSFETLYTYAVYPIKKVYDSKRRFSDHKHVIRYFLIRQDIHKECEFYWPKGKAEYCETSLQSAKRETMEETGVDITDGNIIFYYPIKDSFVGINNLIYNVNLWLVEFEKKPDTFISSPYEISNVAWVSDLELEKYMPNKKMHIQSMLKMLKTF